MNYLAFRMMFTFPLLFWLGINPHKQRSTSNTFKEATEAYKKGTTN